MFKKKKCQKQESYISLVMFYFLKTVLFEIEDDVQNYENELWTPSWEMIEMKMIKCKAQN